MNTVSLLHHRPHFFSLRKIQLQFPILLVGWMAITSIIGFGIMGLVMDGILRNILDYKEEELLAGRHLALSTAFREAGLPGVERLLKLDNFKHDYIRLTNRDGSVLREENPDHVQFTRPLRPMSTLDGQGEVPHWTETTTYRGLDYDLYTGKLPGGISLQMGFNEEPQEQFFHRSERLAAEISVTFIAISLLGAGILLHRFRASNVE